MRLPRMYYQQKKKKHGTLSRPCPEYATHALYNRHQTERNLLVTLSQNKALCVTKGPVDSAVHVCFHAVLFLC